jgi:hypothetical protein
MVNLKLVEEQLHCSLISLLLNKITFSNTLYIFSSCKCSVDIALRICITLVRTVFLKVLILRARSARKINTFRKTVQSIDRSNGKNEHRVGHRLLSAIRSHSAPMKVDAIAQRSHLPLLLLWFAAI